MRAMILASLFLLFVACGGEETPTPGPAEIDTEGPTPTVAPTTPPPTVDIQGAIDLAVAQAIRAAVSSVVPTQVPAAVSNPVEPSTPEPESTATPEATLAPTPRPTPTPLVKFRPVSPPAPLEETNSSLDILRYSSTPTIKDFTLTLNATFENQPDLIPDVIQVWEAKEQFIDGAECGSERPIIFIRAGLGASRVPAYTEYIWDYCIDEFHQAISQRVPWVDATSWSINLRGIKYVWEPRIYDFHISADILRADSGWQAEATGYIIMVWDGGKLISKVWVPIDED